MLEKDYKLMFEDKMCELYDKNHGGRLITTIQMIKNKIFPITFLEKDGGFVFFQIKYKNTLWHMKLGHLNFLELENSSSNGERATTSRRL